MNGTLRNADRLLGRLRMHLASALKDEEWAPDEFDIIEKDMLEAEFVQVRLRECLAILVRHGAGQPLTRWLDHQTLQSDTMGTEDS